MKDVLAKYLNKNVGINLDKANHIDAAQLVGAGDDYFSVRATTDGHLHHIMYCNVLQVTEDEQGVEIRHLFTSNERFQLVIKIAHIAAYTPA